MSNPTVKLTKKPGPTYPAVDDIYSVSQEPIPSPDSLKANEVLVQTLYLSIDAAMRVWITGQRTYIDGVKPGDIMPA